MFILFIALICFALLHFIYEGILVPSLRLKYRFKLFYLRDELRYLQVVHSDKLTGELYNYLQDSINISLKFLHQIDLKTIIWAYMSTDDNELLNKEINARLRLLRECPIKEVRDIGRQVFECAGYLVLVNNGALFFYVIPIIFIGLFAKNLKALIKNFVTIPENEIAKIISLENPQIA